LQSRHILVTFRGIRWLLFGRLLRREPRRAGSCVDLSPE